MTFCFLVKTITKLITEKRIFKITYGKNFLSSKNGDGYRSSGMKFISNQQSESILRNQSARKFEKATETATEIATRYATRVSMWVIVCMATETATKIATRYATRVSMWVFV